MVQIQGAIYYAAIPYLSEQFSQLQNGQDGLTSDCFEGEISTRTWNTF